MASMSILTSAKPSAGRGPLKVVLLAGLALVALLVLLLPGVAFAATPPAIASLSASSGPTVGGATVVISGTGFSGVSGASAVLFGSTPAASYTVDSASQITAVTPAHSSGAVHVTVTGAGGTSAATAADSYTFMVRYDQTDLNFFAYSGTWNDYPKTAAWHGSYGRSSTASSSVTVTFEGTRLDWIAMKGTTTGKADVYVDDVFQTTVDLARATAVYQQDVWSARDLPNGTHKVKFVLNSTSASGKFLVIDAVDVLGSLVPAPPKPPTVTSIASSSGPTDGGATVVIKGSGFSGLSGASAVLFGSTPAASYTVNSATQITAVTPAHDSGKVDVSVTAAGGTSATNAADSYTFMVRYDQGDWHLVKSGTWSDYAKPAAWQGSYGRSSTSGASVTVTFEGTRLDWIAMKGTTAGKADVYLDGVLKTTVDLAAATAVYQQDVWSTRDLPNGTHKVKFVLNSTSASGKFLVIDAVDVLGSVVDTVTRYEQGDSRLVYSGTWSTQSVPQASGGTSSHGYEKSAGVIVTFTGTRLDWIATLAPENGVADVSLDGGALTKVDLYSETTHYQQKVWTTGTLTNGTHWVEIRWDNANRTDKVTHTFISADAFDVVGVLPSPSSLSTAEVKWAEQRLTDLSYRPGPIDGVKDKYTKSAVIAFEEWEGLPRDGVIGAAVWTRLQTATRPTPTQTSPGTNPWIEVDKTKQVLLYCKDGAVVWTLHVSTGTASVSGGRVTPSGTWTILAKWAMPSYRSTYYPMDYDASQDPILAIHGYPNVPTYPASHGCVRLETWDQDALFPLIAIGTYVYIY
jgi:lipoprotein-anchoring transpeptidase ErfK/SrfK